MTERVCEQEISNMPTDEQLTLLSLCKTNAVNWNLLAREAQKPGGLKRLVSGELSERSPDIAHTEELLRDSLKDLDQLRRELQASIQPVLDNGARLTTVIDADYPPSLRTIFNLPPFLFIKGTWLDGDARSVAVVGTRRPSPQGVAIARELSRQLVERDVTVISGLAAGIDTAAHDETLSHHGRTVAVLGTGINRTYPIENQELVERILTRDGAIVSQFWPDQAPAKYTFPRRNVVTSGLSQGTVVVEASATSGAKMQARIAHEHGKRVFLVRRLVTEQAWARDYIAKRKAVEVSSVDDIIEMLHPAEVVRDRSLQVHQEALQL
jgi:DNA processing protein